MTPSIHAEFMHRRDIRRHRVTLWRAPHLQIPSPSLSPPHPKSYCQPSVSSPTFHHEARRGSGTCSGRGSYSRTQTRTQQYHNQGDWRGGGWAIGNNILVLCCDNFAVPSWLWESRRSSARTTRKLTSTRRREPSLPNKLTMKK